MRIKKTPTAKQRKEYLSLYENKTDATDSDIMAWVKTKKKDSEKASKEARKEERGDTNRRTMPRGSNKTNANKKTTSDADATLKMGSTGGAMAASGGAIGNTFAAATGGGKTGDFAKTVGKKGDETGGKKGDKKTTSNADAALKTGSIGGIMAASGGRFGSSLAAATGGVKNLPDKKGDKKGEEEKPDSKAKDKSKKKKAGYFTRVKSFLGKKGEGVNAREVYRRQRKRGGSTKNLLTTDRKENYTMTGGRGKGLDVDSADKSYDSRYKKKKGGGTGASVNKKTSLTEGQKAKAMAKRMIELSATKPVYGGPGKAVKNNNKTGPGGNKSDWNTTKFTDPQLKTRNKRLFNVLKKGR